MKKFFAFVAVALASVSMMAEKVPTAADLAPLCQNGHLNVCFLFEGDAQVCNDVVFTGTFNGWSENPAECVKMEEVDGFPGWYFASVKYGPEATSIMGKPVQLYKGGFDGWAYQVGDNASLTVVEGDVTLASGLGAGESDITYNDLTKVTIIRCAYWKNHNNPCTAVSKTYHVLLNPPYCESMEDWTPCIIGGFNGWSEGDMTLITAEGEHQFWYEATVEATVGSEYKFKQKIGDSKNYTNELEKYYPGGINEEGEEYDESWGGYDNLVFGEEIELVYDWAETYRIKGCDEATAVENVAVENKAVKVIENGQLILIKNGVRYNTVGAQL